MTLLLGGALRFTKYDFFQEQFVKFVVMKRAAIRAPSAITSSLTGTHSLTSLIDFLRRPAEQGGA